MLERSVGALVITDDSGSTPLHIVTDRDLVVMLAEGLDRDHVTVECLAFPRLRTIGAGTTLADAARVMREAGVRRLPSETLAGRAAPRRRSRDDEPVGSARRHPDDRDPAGRQMTRVSHVCSGLAEGKRFDSGSNHGLEGGVPRNVGDRYVCEKCGAALVYETACPCPAGTHAHSEICCGQQMKAASKTAAPSKK